MLPFKVSSSETSRPEVVNMGSGRGERQAKDVPSSWTFEGGETNKQKSGSKMGVYQIINTFL
jgi:hypothetical protein